MAIMQVRICDRCGKKEGGKVEIVSCDLKREDGAHGHADLCTTCAGTWLALLLFTAGSPRREFEVVEYDQIPRESG